MNKYNIIIEEFDQETMEFIGKEASSDKCRSLIPIAFGNNDITLAYVKDIETAISFGLIEDIGSPYYITQSLINKMPKYKWEEFGFKTRFKDIILKYPKTTQISEGKEYTFGVEIETCNGYIPPYLCDNLAIAAHYDGSIYDDDGTKASGAEYVTDVLKYDIGFKHLNDILTTLSRRCKINKTCSIHVHFGNFDANKENIVLLYKLGYIIQEELFRMMPPSRSRGEYCRRISGKSLTSLFTNKIPKNIRNIKRSFLETHINESYSLIVNEISLGHNPSEKINKKFNHPYGRFCGYNRGTPRYWWLNFVPLLFTLEPGRDLTIEFRPHSATLKYEKIKNFILICMGILSFVENHKDIIYNVDMKSGSITLNQIIDATYTKKNEYLKKYISNRINLFSSNYQEKDEYDYYENLNEFSQTINIL